MERDKVIPWCFLIAAASAPAQFYIAKSLGPYKIVRVRDRDPLMVAAATLGPNRKTDKIRATLLAQAYFYRHLGGCGFPEAATDGAAAWLFPTCVGYAGSPGPEIRIDKRMGTTTAPGLPAVIDPRAAYRFVVVRRYEKSSRRPG